MKVVVAMMEDGADVLLVVGRDSLDALHAMRSVAGDPAGREVKIKEVKVGRVYRNLSEEVRIHCS